MAKTLSAAFERARSNDTEEWSQALTSCRRALKAVADIVYPATAEEIDGHKLGDDQFLNRLYQFAREQIASGSQRKFVIAALESVGAMADVLNDLASKGVHSDVDERDLELTIVQTYFIAGEIIALLPPDVPSLPSVSDDQSQPKE